MADLVEHCAKAMAVIDERWLGVFDTHGLVVIERAWLAELLDGAPAAAVAELPALDDVEPARFPIHEVEVPNRSKPHADVVAEAVAAARESARSTPIVRTDPATGEVVEVPEPRATPPRRTPLL